jgi:NTP pyrophosphatase (non-canonical NTP hydrolase)
MNEFDELAALIKKFADARDWEQFHNPKNLAMALTGEAGELAAEFQWLTLEASELSKLSSDQLKAIRLEIADVQIYLSRIAAKLQIDIPRAVKDKLKINETRFPKD